MFLRRSLRKLEYTVGNRVRFMSEVTDLSSTPVVNPVVAKIVDDIGKHVQNKNSHLFSASLRQLFAHSDNKILPILDYFVPLMTTEFIDSMDHEIVYVLDTLGRSNLKVNFKREREMVLRMLKRLGTLNEGLNPLRISTAIVAVSRMGLSHVRLSKSYALNVFLNKVVSFIPTMTGRELVQTLHALQRMDVTSEYLHKSFISNVTARLKVVAPEIQDDYKANLLFSLGRLGFHVEKDAEWRKLMCQLAEDALNSKSSNNIFVDKNLGTSSNFSIIAMGLSSMYIPFRELTPTLRKTIIKAFETKNKTEFSLVVAS